MENILINLKAKLGITSSIRDSYLKFIIRGVVEDLKGKGINVSYLEDEEKKDDRVSALIVDISFLRYRHEEITQNIKSRIKDLIMRDNYGT